MTPTEAELHRAEERIKELEAEAAEHLRNYQEMGAIWNETATALEAATERVKKLGEALRTYGKHHERCQLRQFSCTVRRCSCGLADAMADAPAERAPEPEPCSCKFSDAWRCATEKRLPEIACYCRCHTSPAAAGTGEG